MPCILLVGEGNFSYSASLANFNQGKDLIVATCYETEDAISKQPFSSTNVEQLKKNGALVYFEVDATRLKDYVFLTNHLYDHIIFNFPHCGRKAGVRKNRDLLWKFFLSCVEVLAQKGDIHVALCQGQGGTPADEPRREWHNSWQIVAMAAKAGFILSAVAPFSYNQYHGYQSTGYSQEKSFHVDGSLNHIFTRSLPLDNLTALHLIDRLTDSSASVQDQEYCDNQVLRQLIGRERFHPVNLLYEELIERFQTNFTLNTFDDEFPLICEVSSFSSIFKCPESWKNVFYVTDRDGIRCGSVDGTQGSQMSSSQHNVAEDSVHDSKANSSGLSYLRPSLTSFIKDIAERSSLIPGTLYVLSGPVFRKCLISPWMMPVYQELILFLCCSPSDTKSSQLQLVMETIENAMASITNSVLLNDELDFSKQPLNVQGLHFYQKTSVYYFINNDSNEMIGTIRIVTSEELSSDRSFIIITLNLDLMAMCLLGIEDWRQLWTDDERFIQQFSQRKLKPFKKFSLYPPCYTHDISFWVEDGAVFDEIEFHNITRRVSWGNIVTIELLEQYEDVKMGKNSRCYRMTYQSCDQALSYESALKIQLQLREELGRCLHITLR
ncbi:ferredoxin-fold anticodon-binding domain-containing protein 1 isoform X2 [Aquarana catesbeiana]|uniref:ferredoxin-fold anticodon-binding domain-containing protein 1 isoform X2 n=1 Tax=Aquarana catesbeiana TaxID=8400 RepID=UPI003CC9691C